MVGRGGSTVEQGSTFNRSAQAEVAQLDIRDPDLDTVAPFSMDLGMSRSVSGQLVQAVSSGELLCASALCVASEHEQ